MLQAVRYSIKAYRIKQCLNRLRDAKENTIRKMVGLPPLRPWYRECFTTVLRWIRDLCCRAFCPCCLNFSFSFKFFCPETICCGRLFIPGKIENEMLRSCGGFLCGIAMSFCAYFLMAWNLKYPVLEALLLSMLTGVTMSVGLAFSSIVRCVTLLMLPQFFSSKGRSFLLMYAMVLVMNHPVKNFNHNLQVLSEMSTCGQELAKNETREMISSALSPLTTILDGLRKMLDGMLKFANQLRQSFLALKKAVEEIASTVGRLFKWLGSILDICNEKMGEPYKKCMGAFNNAAQDCRNRLGIFGFLCNIVDWISNVCHIARIGELLCMIASAVTGFIKEKFGGPVAKSVYNVYDQFYFNVTIDYRFNVTMNQSKSYSQIKEDILNEVKGRMAGVRNIIDVIDNTLVVTSAFLLIKALMYRFKYLTNERFDNCYVTATVVSIDEKRAEMGMEGILPLKAKEWRKFVPTSSIWLISSEAKKMKRGAIMLLFSMTHAGFYVAVDYGLYWLLCLIREHFEIKTHPPSPPHLKLHVQGKGAMADMYRALVSLLDPAVTQNLEIDTTPCLPNPGVPNIRVYKQLLAIYLFCFFVSVFQAYGLRLRHVIAGCYYPQRERERALWLYNHILRQRGGWLEFTRRQLRRKYKGDKTVTKVTLRGRLMAKYPCCRKLIKGLGFDRKLCLSCGTEGRPEDYENFQHCESPGCDAVYCMQCFEGLNNLCTLCMNPVDYGDYSDVSEELDSSEDEAEIERRREESRKKKKLREKKKRRSHLMQKFNFVLGSSKEKPEEPEALLSSSSSSSSSGSSSGSFTDSSDDGFDYDYQYRKDLEGEDGWQWDVDSEARRPSLLKEPRVTMQIFHQGEDRDSDFEDDWYHGVTSPGTTDHIDPKVAQFLEWETPQGEEAAYYNQGDPYHPYSTPYSEGSSYYPSHGHTDESTPYGGQWNG